MGEKKEGDHMYEISLRVWHNDHLVIKECLHTGASSYDKQYAIEFLERMIARIKARP